MIESEYTFDIDLKDPITGTYITDMKIKVYLELEYESGYNGGFEAKPTECEIFMGGSSTTEIHFRELPASTQKYLNTKLSELDERDFGLEICDFEEEVFQ